MIHPSDSDSTRQRAVRDGQSAPVTCAACGCRLEHTPAAEGSRWFHFSRFAGRDARGCRVECIDQAHDALGLPFAAVPA
jgi:transcription initiation factor TFIIIB Brf1 subunit/transcription initiation factor TFIIB